MGILRWLALMISLYPGLEIENPKPCGLRVDSLTNYIILNYFCKFVKVFVITARAFIRATV